ncbi:katanin p80 WD40 repeat-containing subunit B1-like [Polypterus senegalus]
MAAGSKSKKSWKLQDIIAHSSNISSLALEKTSGDLLATGGEDCFLNIWTINRPNCIMCLTAHNTPVDCIRFSSTEKQVVAGLRSGSLRLWDLRTAKMLRTFMGHKANICSLDFHPFGEHLASGSLDTNIKLWDVRQKGCIFSYKGHMQGVRCLCFSPHGKWLASSSDDSTIKLWDLTAGKMITQFTSHSGPVKEIAFHPNEYLLASGSSDRTVKFWDLDKFQMICSTEVETNPVNCIAFHPDGWCLYSGSQDSLKVYTWEPYKCLDAMPVTWGKVADMAIYRNHLIGVSYNMTNAFSYTVNHKSRNHGSFDQNFIQNYIPHRQLTATDNIMQKNFEKTFTLYISSQQIKKKPDSNNKCPEKVQNCYSNEKDTCRSFPFAEVYNEIFHPKNIPSWATPVKTNTFSNSYNAKSLSAKLKPQLDMAPVTERINFERSGLLPFSLFTSVNRVKPTIVSPTTWTHRTHISSPREMELAFIHSFQKHPIGLNPAEFLPPVKNDENILLEIVRDHEDMCVVLSTRRKNLNQVRATWSTGDIKTSLELAVTINDMSTIVDILNIINFKPCFWKLELSALVLPQIEKLLQSKYETYVQTGCMSLECIIQCLLPLIVDRLSIPPSTDFDMLDMPQEGIHQTCKACYKQLKNLHNVVKSKAGLVGYNASTLQELYLLLTSLK